MLAAKYRHDDNVENVYLLTGDSDWKQLVNEKTTWVALREDAKHKRINMEMFAELTGYPTPKAFLEGKALQGDKSDNIQQVGGIGEGAQDLLHGMAQSSLWFAASTMAQSSLTPGVIKQPSTSWLATSSMRRQAARCWMLFCETSN